jgi:hypothetical protein
MNKQNISLQHRFKQLAFINQLTVMKTKIYFNQIHAWVNIGLATPFAIIGTGNSNIVESAKKQQVKAMAFVKRIFHPLGSNYLVYSGISPGWARSGPMPASQLKIINRLAVIEFK